MSAFYHLIKMMEVLLHIFQLFYFEITKEKHSQSYQRLPRPGLFIIFNEKEGSHLLSLIYWIVLIFFQLKLRYSQNCGILLHEDEFLNMQCHLFVIFSLTFFIYINIII